MNCKDVEKHIVSGEELPFEAQMHLMQCKECQRFSEVYLLASGIAGEPSAECDAKCRAMFRRESGLLRVYRHRLISSIAAALVIICGTLTFFVIQSDIAESEIASADVDFPEEYDEDWLLLANEDLEHLIPSAEDDKTPMKQLYVELASLEVDFYDFF